MGCSGSQLYISGQIPFTSNGLLQGRLGENVSVEEGQEAARHCVLNMCAQVDLAVGLDAVKTVLKVEGFVNTTPDFGDHPEVVNGASDLLGDFRQGSRAAFPVRGWMLLPSAQC